MRRRDFHQNNCWIGRHLVAHRSAQQIQGMRRIAILTAFAEPEPEVQSWFAAFVQQLRDLGWIEGANIQIDTGRLMSAASTEPRWS